MNTYAHFLLILLLSIFTLSGSLYPEEIHFKKDSGLKSDMTHITFKVATLAPGGTFASEAINTVKKNFYLIKERFGLDVNMIAYYGGVMGDDPQMVQKAKMGQLDMLGITLSGLSMIAKELEVINMAYLIEDYGMFDYIMTQNSALINDLFYKSGWISITLITSEGQHDLYLKDNLRTPEAMINNIKAANYTGGPDNTFFEAVGIPQNPIGATELYVSMKSGVTNAAILPSAFVIGMQIYSSAPFVIAPKIRISTSALVLTKRKWETVPWDFRTYLPILQPAGYYAGGGLVRDASFAFADALSKHGLKTITLTQAEQDELKKRVTAYREKFIGDDPVKRNIYNSILKSIAEYKSGNPVEKRIFQSDPTYINFPDKVENISKAVLEYRKTGNKELILKLHEDGILERWRAYDFLVACEHYIKTKDHSQLYKWMKKFYISEVTDEIFTKHLDSVYRLFGTKEALDNRMEEFSKAYELAQGYYHGFQKAGFSFEEQKKYGEKMKAKEGGKKQ